ncbi:uroporphyrinogen-III synthase [Saccharicrinis aurantiacus]|uniref:uroporphyrinogen-III synthase n=1 Tax=Saccharicrinis aurantiacus TaxID=1849719 RepID=UPI000838EA32|nr:uroporphyrinogen-III synthase [Saccharicrinis aurantiacus]
MIKERLLEGKTIISTRPANRSKDLIELIENEGGTLIQFPLIELSAAQNNNIDSALNNFESFSHIAFTSVFGFNFFLDCFKKLDNYKTLLNKIKITSIGYRTSEEIKKAGFNIAFDANAKTGYDFAVRFNKYINGESIKVLWPTGNLSPNQILENTDPNIELTRINIYHNTMPSSIDNSIINRIEKDEYDLIITASPSAVNNLNKVTKANNLKLVCIGKTTTEAAINKGYQPLAMADTPTNKGLCDAILNYYKNNSTIKI